MAAVQERHPGAMAAVIGPSADAVAAWCARSGEVGVANHNGPAQTVVSGTVGAVEELCAHARGAGARVLRLPVGGAFHSPAMQPVRAALERSVAAMRWRAPEVPLAVNASGAILSSAEDVRAALVEQVAAPVRWVECVRALVAAGCTTFLELGPGRVLGGLVRAVAPEVEVYAADSREALIAVAARRGYHSAASAL
jgi:[acyl-carrier-protein] S-malonyltransferase